MPIQYPGVFVEEIPSGANPIQGVPTSDTGFIGQALKGPINDPIRVTKFAEFERVFGGLWAESPMSFAVQQYFLNGGQVAVVVRVAKENARPKISKVPTVQRNSNDSVGFQEIADPRLAGNQFGIWAFDKTAPINLLCIPPFSPQVDVDFDTWQAALKYCKTRKAFLIVDPPSNWENVKDVSLGVEKMGLRDENAAIYFPYLQITDPLKRNSNFLLAPSGAIAGIIARIDLNRGVWKAPAGVDANFANNPKLSVPLIDVEIEELNQQGINSLRDLSNVGSVIWGARTIIGCDQYASEWKYIPVRRTALFIEKSLMWGLQWVVFEPNDEPLWAQIRMRAGNFLNDLFRQGAFAGNTPDKAYFVNCDQETITPSDIVQGKVNLLVGFAPLKPAEFIILKLQFTTNQGN